MGKEEEEPEEAARKLRNARGLGQRDLQRQILQKHKKAGHGNPNSNEGLIQKHVCQVPMAHVFGGIL